jgi:hypothetical protein
VHTRAGCERIAAARLERELHMTVYIPEVLQRRQGAVQAAPLFPGYLFVLGPSSAAEEAAALDAVDCTPGCGQIVRLANGSELGARTPTPLPCEVIEWLRRRIAAIDQAGGLPVQVLRPCDAAAGEAAPLPELEAALSGLHSPAARVTLLLLALRQQGLDGGAGERQDEGAPAVKRLRRTRGRGRRIHYR